VYLCRETKDRTQVGRHTVAGLLQLYRYYWRCKVLMKLGSFESAGICTPQQ
jgi:hypothetical protein